MKPPPAQPDRSNLLCWLDLSGFEATGNTRHYWGDELMPKPAALSICQYDGDAGVYLFYHDPEWEIQADTWHETVDDAKHQAGYEFAGAEDAGWQSPAV